MPVGPEFFPRLLCGDIVKKYKKENFLYEKDFHTSQKENLNTKQNNHFFLRRFNLGQIGTRRRLVAPYSPLASFRY